MPDLFTPEIMLELAEAERLLVNAETLINRLGYHQAVQLDGFASMMELANQKLAAVRDKMALMRSESTTNVVPLIPRCRSNVASGANAAALSPIDCLRG